MAAYYNEIEPFAAQWLRNLIVAGLIPAGDVDERSIEDVDPADLDGYDQCHFFAGIGGWSHALRLAGWPDDRPAWTGSCPCQPLSSAGARRGHADERHLWPAFYRLIAERRPAVVLGEQVASKLGREWLAGVRADLEDTGYACGAADLCAAGLGAPHIRQRLFWVADAGRSGDECRRGPGEARGAIGTAEGEARQRKRRRSHAGRGGELGGLGDADPARPQAPEREAVVGAGRRGEGRATGEPSPAPDGFWDAFDILPCTDGKARRTGPGLFPLAHGVPVRVGRLRAYGNAISPPVAAEFVRACMGIMA